MSQPFKVAVLSPMTLLVDEGHTNYVAGELFQQPTFQLADADVIVVAGALTDEVVEVIMLQAVNQRSESLPKIKVFVIDKQSRDTPQYGGLDEHCEMSTVSDVASISL